MRFVLPRVRPNTARCNCRERTCGREPQCGEVPQPRMFSYLRILESLRGKREGKVER